ncbi:MAG: FAD-binding protein [Coriobacteriales bacterium]|jgi:succinate dehydrogenase/fumarate reductase flavoprotein subunit|nr:FAD-binding protein [Coriobacteriales bacterium]
MKEDLKMKETGLSRRQFLGGAGIALTGALAGAAGASLVGCSETADTQEAGVVAYHESIKWDAEYDAVVVGFGLAGAAAAVSAAEAGVKRILLLEKAPYGEEGGNSKVCEQYCLAWDNEKDGTEYMIAMSQGMPSATPEIIQFMAKGGAENKDWLLSLGVGELMTVLNPGNRRPMDFWVDRWGEVILADYEIGEYLCHRDDGTASFGEYPILPDGTWNDGRSYWTSLDGPDNHEKRLWKGMRKQVVDRADTIDIWMESPAVSLIQDPVSKTVLGVVVDRMGDKVNVRALNGVALTTGSMEANMAMLGALAQRYETYPIGSVYNTGDGVIMGMSAGAEMWHMTGLSGPWLLPKLPEEDRCYFSGTMRYRWLQGGECIHIDSRGKRFAAEHGNHKHGHLRVGDTMQNQQLPNQMWAIFNIVADTDNQVPKIDHSLVITAASAEELAAKIGIDAATLSKTVADYNSYCASGVDLEFLRDARTLKALDTANLCAVRLYPAIVNSQAGPRRNIKCEVLDTLGNPIPGLYSAGELGSFWAGAYEAGGNIAECLYTGRAVGVSLAEKTPLPKGIVYEKIESNPNLTGNDLLAIEQGGTQVVLGSNEYLGVGEGLHGFVKVKVKYIDGKIISIDIVEHHETAGITDLVWSDMPKAIVTANSAEVDVVSGATISSHALIEAVMDAISQAR